jgi:hypothetical protein
LLLGVPHVFMHGRLPPAALRVVCVEHVTGSRCCFVGLAGWPHTHCWVGGADADADTKPISYWFACSSVSAALPSFSEVVAVACTQKATAASLSSMPMAAAIWSSSFFSSQ